jgi:hypothetical protein
MLLASSGQKPGMLHRTVSDPTTKNNPTPNINRAELEKLCRRLQCL